MRGALAAAALSVTVIFLAGLFAGPDDCPRGSVTVSGIARCR